MDEFVKTALTFVQNAGPLAAPLLFLWGWTERAERKEAQRDRNLLLERVLKQGADNSDAIRDLASLISGGRRRA